jgi:hypothetical protein
MRPTDLFHYNYSRFMIPNVNVNINANINANIKLPLLCPISVDASVQNYLNVVKGIVCATSVEGLFETRLYGVGTQLHQQGIWYLWRRVGVRQGLVDHESNAK